MMNLGDAIQTVQALLGDPKGQWVKRGYIVPFINLAYGLVTLNLKNASGKNLQAVVPVLNVPAGTTSLYPWQGATAQAGQPVADQAPKAVLSGLTDPIEVWVKPAGQPVWMYRRIGERDTLPHVDPVLASANAWNSMWWTFTGNKLQITPVGQALDIEVTGKFNPPKLVDDGDLLQAHEDIWMPVTLKASVLGGVERSNPAILEGYKMEEVAAEDNIGAEIIRQRQATPARFQKMSREGGGRGGTWWWA